MAKIRKSRAGTWFVDYIVRVGLSSQRVRAYGFATKAEAEKFRNDLLLRPLDQKIDYQQIIQKPLLEAIEHYNLNATMKKASKQNEKVYFERLIEFTKTKKKFDGNLASIDPLMVSELQSWLMDYRFTRAKDPKSKIAKYRPMSASTVNRYFHTYRNFFEKCRQWNFIRKNPCEFLVDLHPEPKTRSTWTADQCYEVIGSLPEWAQRVLVALAATAGRRGEVCRLLPEKVDLKGKFIILRSRKGQGRIVERPIPMTDGFHKFMTEQMEMCKKNKWPYVFVNFEGRQISPTYLTNLVKRTASKLGHKSLTPHGLRHTLLSILANSGTGLNTVKQLAGHSNLATTQGYLHTNTGHVMKALESHNYVDKLQDLLAAKGHKKGSPK